MMTGTHKGAVALKREMLFSSLARIYCLIVCRFEEVAAAKVIIIFFNVAIINPFAMSYDFPKAEAYS